MLSRMLLGGGRGRNIPGGLGRWGVDEGEVAWSLENKGELGACGWA